MDESLRKKVLYIICAGVIIFLVVIALLFLFRKPQQEKVITRTEYIQQEAVPEKEAEDVKAFLPPLSSTESAIPLAQQSTNNQSTSQNNTTQPTTSTPGTTTTTTTTSVSKAWNFFRQSISLPWIFIVATFPSANTSCGKANQPLCPAAPGSVTYVTNETRITHITIIQHVIQIPNALLDSLQDIVFYKFITLLQQSVLANGRYPIQYTAEGTSWLTELITTGEMSQFYYDVFKATNAQAKLCGTPLQEGFCYESNGKSTNLYVRLRAATAECPNGAIKTWNSDKNALQVTCF
jgi:hypothetical protein